MFLKNWLIDHICNEDKKIVQEVSAMRQTERGNRTDDKRSENAMEDRKKLGYF